MDVTFYMHYFDAKKMFKKGAMEPADFEADMLQVVDYITSLPVNSRKKDDSKDKITMFLYECNYYSDESILLLQFRSAKYSKSRKVVNTKNWKEQPAKRKATYDGDEERTYIAIKFKNGTEAYCINQTNSDGVSFSRIVGYLNYWIKIYHQEEVKDTILYRIATQYMVSKDFLKALARADRIRGVRLVMDQKDLDVSENKAFAERNDISKDITVCYKPAKRGRSIRHNTVKDFFDMYNDKSKAVKKIYVDSVESDGSPLRFDTDQMKDRHVEDIPESITGELEYNKLVIVMKRIIVKYK